MDTLRAPGVTALAALGIVAGLVLLYRGLQGYRSQIRVSDTSTSAIGSMAAGEVRVSGRIEPAEMTLISLLQSVACVYYRSTVGDAGERRARDHGYVDERSIGFRVRDATGTLRVFPRGARFDAPLRFQAETGTLGDEPAGLDIRRGGSTQVAELDRAVAAAELLRVRAPDEWSPFAGVGDADGRRSYREARLEPGDAVTIIGRAIPFSELSDPAGADIANGSGEGLGRSRGRGGPCRGAGGRHACRRSGASLGKRRDPRLRDRPPGRGTRDRPRCRPAAAGQSG